MMPDANNKIELSICINDSLVDLLVLRDMFLKLIILWMKIILEVDKIFDFANALVKTACGNVTT